MVGGQLQIHNLHGDRDARRGVDGHLGGKFPGQKRLGRGQSRGGSAGAGGVAAAHGLLPYGDKVFEHGVTFQTGFCRPGGAGRSEIDPYSALIHWVNCPRVRG